MARVAFPNGIAMYATYTTVTDYCPCELLPATAGEASRIVSASSREEADLRLDTVRRRHVGMPRDEYQRSIPPLADGNLPDDVVEVRIKVPEYNDEGWTSKASKGARLVAGQTSAESGADERRKEDCRLRAADRAAQSAMTRSVVRDRVGHAMRATESRLIAWWTWFRSRSDGATAHDRRSWIEDDRRWIRCGDLPPGQRAN